MDAQLREAKADRKESERDRRTTEAVEQLKRFFPGNFCLLLAWNRHSSCLPVCSAVQGSLGHFAGQTWPC